MSHEAMCTFCADALTPADEGDQQNVAVCDLSEHNDEFLEHEQSLSSHPHPCHQGKVVYEHANCDAASSIFCPVDASHKYN